MKTITIFGSSIPVEEDPEYRNAFKIGRSLAEKGISVCTGGYGGIMEAVSKGAFGFEVNIIGVTVDTFSSEANGFVNEEFREKTLLDRLNRLIKTGDGYIVLPGGTGTLLELAAIWEFMNKNLISEKPVYCLGKMWEPVIESLEKRISEERRKTGLIKYFDDVDLLIGQVISDFSL